MGIAKNKKILFVYYKLFKAGGVARVLVSLANELVNNGYEVTILILTSNSDSFYRIDKRVQIISINTFSHWGFTKINVNLDKFGSKIPFKNNIKNYVYDFGQWSMLNKWINKNHKDYDIVISCWYKLSAQLALNKNVRTKTIAWEHANYEVGGKLWNDTLRRYFKKLKAVVCINNNSYKHYKNININTFMIPNIVGNPFEDFSNLQMVNKEDTLIYVGRLDSDKNVEELINVLEHINFKNYKFKIIGDGPSKISLQNKVNTNKKIKNKIEFLGLQDIKTIYNELSKSKIFLFTSKTEAFGLVLLEAMFTGNAIISYDCNYGPSDIINDNNGFLIPMHNKKMFKEKLQLLIDNNSKLNDLCKSSYEESKKWRKEKIINQWLEILN